MRTGFVTQFRTYAGRGHLTAAPPFDPQCKAQRRVGQAAFDLAQPAPALGAELQLNGALLKGEAAISAVRGEGHGAEYSDHLNISSRLEFQMVSTDRFAGCSHDLNMAATEAHDWYLREWFATLGLKQRDLVTKLDYQPAAAHALWHSVQRYRRDHIAEISGLLNIQPYELLMPPEEAMALRRLRTVIAEVAKAEPVVDETVSTEKARTGTAG